MNARSGEGEAAYDFIVVGGGSAGQRGRRPA